MKSILRSCDIREAIYDVGRRATASIGSRDREVGPVSLNQTATEMRHSNVVLSLHFQIAAELQQRFPSDDSATLFYGPYL